MANRATPRNWSKIVQSIKIRADHRCECGTIWDCGSGVHASRCPNRDGGRYQDNGREVRLRVVQVGADDDYRPQYLVALCLRCVTVWSKQREEKLRLEEERKAVEESMNPLFDLIEGQPNDVIREQN